MNKSAILILCCTLLGVLSGCMTNPNRADSDALAKVEPLQILARKDLGYSCLDLELVDFQVKKPIYIVSKGLTSKTTSLTFSQNASQEAIKTSIEKLTSSKTFSFIDQNALVKEQYDADPNGETERPISPTPEEAWLYFLNRHPKSRGFQLPGFIIAGSISELDEMAVPAQASAIWDSLQIDSIGVSPEDIASVFTVKMRANEFNGKEFNNAPEAINYLIILKGDDGINGYVKTIGGFYKVSYENKEGLLDGVRSLIELGSMELMGGLAKVPYGECMQPAPVNATENWYDRRHVSEIQRLLYRLDNSTKTDYAAFYQGIIDGQMNEETTDAILAYQIEAKLYPTGKIDQTLYRSLKNPPPSAFAPRYINVPPVLSYELENGQQVENTINVINNSKLVIGIRPNRKGYVQCFFKSHNNEIFRIFPTRDQNNDRIRAGQLRVIPASESHQINLTAPSDEEIGCIASRAPFLVGSRLILSAVGTNPVPNVQNLQQVLTLFRKIMDTSAMKLTILRFVVK